MSQQLPNHDSQVDSLQITRKSIKKLFWSSVQKTRWLCLTQGNSHFPCLLKEKIKTELLRWKHFSIRRLIVFCKMLWIAFLTEQNMQLKWKWHNCSLSASLCKNAHKVLTNYTIPGAFLARHVSSLFSFPVLDLVLNLWTQGKIMFQVQKCISWKDEACDER